MQELNYYEPIAEALTLLFFPHVEVVIHDLKTNSIQGIFNPFSKRKIGDASLLVETEQLSKELDVFPPYFKINWNGTKTKSATAVLRDSKRAPIGLFCINLDISKWEELYHLIQDFVRGISAPAEFLFENDWREKINIFVTNYLKKHSLKLDCLSRKEKQNLVVLLHQEGAFEAKNAAAYIANILKISRASVYNYLKNRNEPSSI